jgi:voltage-dependent potassium channel beta subunit
MEYRRLGNSGLQLSILSFGSWLTFGSQIAEKMAEDCMKIAYDGGINFFDNAEYYANGQSEIVMGNVIKKMGWSRDTFVVSSKVFWGGDLPNQKGLSRKHVVEACHAALKRLQVDYLDLYYCHRPDYETPIEETVRAMSDLIAQGKVLYWGTSEWSAQEIQAAYGIARQYNLIPPVVEQPQYNMFHRKKMEIEYRRIFKDMGIGTTIWSPLASGLLTGKYNDGVAPKGSRAELEGMGWLKDLLVGESAKPKVEKVKKMTVLAGDLGITMPQLAIAWCLKNPNVSSAILGASKISQIESNLKTVDALPKLTDEVMEELETILDNKPNFVTF